MAKKAAPRAKSSFSGAKSMQDLELLLQALGEQLGDDLEPENDVDKAQEIMFDAWDARGSKQRIALAHKALAVSPLCADAYVMLAAEAEKTLPEKIARYREGIAAGEKALGKQVFKEDAGMFWGLIETRPYMRAMHGLAGALWDIGAQGESVEALQEMLRLNPNDNQGVRYELLDHLIESGRDKEAKGLAKAYKDDSSAAWAFSLALLQFRTSGDSEKSRQLLKSAIERNPHVATYLTGTKSMPRKLPAYYGMGDDSEAIVYALTGRAPWAATTGALDWLEQVTSG